MERSRAHSTYNIIVLRVYILTYNNNIDKSNKFIKLLTTLVDLSMTLVVIVILTENQGGMKLTHLFS